MASVLCVLSKSLLTMRTCYFFDFLLLFLTEMETGMSLPSEGSSEASVQVSYWPDTEGHEGARWQGFHMSEWEDFPTEQTSIADKYMAWVCCLILWFMFESFIVLYFRFISSTPILIPLVQDSGKGLGIDTLWGRVAIRGSKGMFYGKGTLQRPQSQQDYCDNLGWWFYSLCMKLSHHLSLTDIL